MKFGQLGPHGLEFLEEWRLDYKRRSGISRNDQVMYDGTAGVGDSNGGRYFTTIASDAIQPETPGRMAANILSDENIRRSIAAQSYVQATHHCVPWPVFDSLVTALLGSVTTNLRTRPKIGDKVKIPKQQECTACTNKLAIHDLIMLPCTHDYCQDCLTKLFTYSLRDELPFPPRCCLIIMITRSIRLFRT